MADRDATMVTDAMVEAALRACNNENHDSAREAMRAAIADALAAEPMILPDKVRQARSRQARASAGGKQIAVMLTPAAASKLAAHVANGETIAGVVNRLLSRSKPSH